MNTKENIITVLMTFKKFTEIIKNSINSLWMKGTYTTNIWRRRRSLCSTNSKQKMIYEHKRIT